MIDCLHSMAPDDELLLSHALDGVPLPAREKEHVAQCSACQRRLAKYKRANQFLIAQLYRSQCPSATRLSQYCAGLVPGDEVMSIARHLEQCPLCSKEVAETRHIFANFDPHPEVAFSLLDEAQRIVAELVPWEPQLVTRGGAGEAERASQGWPRQYRAEDINISLHLSRASNGEILLLGLMTSANDEESIDEFEGANVELYVSSHSGVLPDRLNGGRSRNGHNGHNGNTQSIQYEDRPLLSTRVDDLGNIVFKAVPAGAYTMIVYLPESELVVEGLTISPT